MLENQNEEIVAYYTETIYMVGQMGKGNYTMNPVINIYKGDNKTIRMYVRKPEDDKAQILTGATCVFKMWDYLTNPPLLTKTTAVPAQGAIIDPLYGEVEFYVLPADTTSLTVRQYIFRIIVTLANGKVDTVYEGLINLK